MILMRTQPVLLGLVEMLMTLAVPGRLRLAPAHVLIACAIVLGLSPALAHADMHSQVVAEPVRIQLSCDSDLPAYDLCWGADTETARQQLAVQAIAKLPDDGSFSVIAIPGVPERWHAIKPGVHEDATGRTIDRRRVKQGRLTYSADIEEALLDIVDRIRAARPNAILAIEGYPKRDTRNGPVYAQLNAAADFVMMDADIDDRLSRRDRQKDLDWKLDRLSFWLKQSGLDEGTWAVLRHTDQFIVVSESPLPNSIETPALITETNDDPPADDSDSGPASLLDEDAPAVETTLRSDPETPEPQRATAASPDINGDGEVNSQDSAMLLGMWGSDNPTGDLNGDGTVDSHDYAMLLASYSESQGLPAVVRGEFTPEGGTYLRSSGSSIGFRVDSGAPSDVRVTLQVWDGPTQSIDFQMIDRDAPFEIPPIFLRTISPGQKLFRAVIYDANSRLLATFARGVVFTDQAPAPAGDDFPGGNDDPDPDPDTETAQPPAQDTGDGGIVGSGEFSIPLGMNLGSVLYYSGEWAFVDVFKYAQFSTGGDSSWDFADPNNLGAPAEDPQGYPIGLKQGQVASVMTSREIPNGGYPGGRYVGFMEGKGRIYLGFDAQAGYVEHNGVGTKRFEFDVNPSGAGIVLRIMESDSNNHIRNIRLIMPGFEETFAQQPFHPLYLERLSPFQVIRFMDWQRTNDSININWADRTRADARSQGGKRGVSVEHMVQLANTLDIDPWFCMPHLATDDYIRQFATLVRDTLEPDQQIYIEFSNECWNYIFPQTWWVQEQADQLGISARRFYAQRSANMFRIWEEVFGGSDRLVRVLGSQAANSGITGQIVNGLPDGAEADAIAIAPYFHVPRLGEDPAVRSFTVDQLIDSVIEDLDQQAIGWMRDTKQIAEQAGLRLIAYEGGQHFVATGAMLNDDQVTSLLNEANRSPRMHDLYKSYFRAWNEISGDVFVAFSFVGPYSKWGSWGHLEYMTQPISEAPKFQALLEIAQVPEE